MQLEEELRALILLSHHRRRELRETLALLSQEREANGSAATALFLTRTRERQHRGAPCWFLLFSLHYFLFTFICVTHVARAQRRRG